jgi:hypothetical protein
MRSHSLIPSLRAMVQLENGTSTAQTADQIGSAIGIGFGNDTIGWFEELNAFVGKVFYFIIGVYEIDDEINGHRMNVELRSMIDRSLLSSHIKDSKIEHFDVSEFLTLILQAKTGMRIHPSEGSEQQLRGKIMIPNLHVALETETHLSLGQISARVGAALGVSFGQTISTLEKGYYRDQPWYVRDAYSFEHQIRIYAATADHRLSTHRPVVVEVKPNFKIEQLGLDPVACSIQKLDISTYIASILQIETDIKFKLLNKEI